VTRSGKGRQQPATESDRVAPTAVFPVREFRGQALLGRSNWRAQSSSAAVRRRGGQLHRDAQPAGGSGVEGERSVVRLGDALDDRQTEADTGVVGAYPFG